MVNVGALAHCSVLSIRTTNSPRASVSVGFERTDAAVLHIAIDVPMKGINLVVFRRESGVSCQTHVTCCVEPQKGNRFTCPARNHQRHD